MAGGLQMKIVSPTGTRFDGEVLRASFPGAQGSFTVLPSHAPIISALKKGTIKYVAFGDRESTLGIEGGFVEVLGNVITACVEVAAGEEGK